jgi:hypothetical protein
LKHERGRDGAKQQKASRPLAVPVDGASQTGEDRGPGLGLVQDDQLPRARERLPFEVQAEPVRLLIEIEV